MARRAILPERPSAKPRTRICRQMHELDRDKCHFLQTSNAGKLSKMGGGDAGRPDLRGQGFEIHNPSKETPGYSYTACQFFRFRSLRAWRETGSDTLAIPGVVQIWR